MSESLLAPSRVKLFGRLFTGLQLVPPDADETEPSGLAASATEQKPDGGGATPDPAFDLLTNQLLRAGATLARIYGYAHEGQYLPLDPPGVFLVHGPGREVDPALAGSIDRSGVAARDWVFEKDVRYWDYDRVNYAIRLDIVSGTLEDLLVDAVGLSEDLDASGAARSHLASRSHLAGRSHLAARSHMNARHRIR